MGEIRIVSLGKTRGYPYPVCKNITIHHECPRRIGNLTRGSKFLLGTRLAEFLIAIPTPKVEISLSHMDWLMMDYYVQLLVNFKPQIRFSNLSGKLYLLNQWFKVKFEQLSVFIGS